ncbi:MAG: CHAT domain-containing protein [Symploca sp. SIO2G7]|nr:CHAT domain-containing protein [Symploca sp. SIO2G7]
MRNSQLPILNSPFPILFLLSLICCLWLGNPPSIAQPENMSANASQLVQQGVDYYQSGDYQAAIKPWENALEFYKETKNYNNSAIVQENLAKTYQKIGHIEKEIEYWQKTIIDYQKLKNGQQMGRIQTELAQAYSNFGQPRKAIALLCGAPDSDENSQEKPGCVQKSALKIARANHNWEVEAAALGNLGNAYLLRGDYNQAIECLQTGLGIDDAEPVKFDISPQRTKDCRIEALSQEYKGNIAADNPFRISFLNDLGNAYFSKAQRWNTWAKSAEGRGAEDTASAFTKKVNHNYQQARNYFQESLELAKTHHDQPAQLRSLRDLIRLPYHLRESMSIDTNQWVQETQKLFQELPDSQDKVYTAIYLAKLEQQKTSDSTSQTNPCSQRLLAGEAEQLLNQAVSIARSIEDYRSESFALGELGHLYKCREDYQTALAFTQQARWAADQNLSAKDSLYLWEWQAGQIFQAQGKETDAINAYEQAIATLEGFEGEQGIRKDILIAQRNLQFDFRDTIEPLYRRFAELTLNRAKSLSSDSKKYEEVLDSALQTVDSLKLAELQNYFGDDCLLTLFNEQQVDKLVTKDTAVFSLIILDDQAAILVSLPNGDQRIKKFKWSKVNSQKLKEEVQDFRTKIQEFYDRTEAFLTPAQNLYNWLIEPFASDLESAQIKTLVFIQDGILRSIPMAALHDGKEFLVEKYAIATTPSLTLTNPQPLNRKQLRGLILGLTETATIDGKTLKELENVRQETEQVATKIPGSKTFLDSEFTRQNLQQELQQTVYPIIHIATHGKFGTIPEDTFLVTGNDQKLTITELEKDIRKFSSGSQPIELLALTACQTATGDDRTTLGLAGIIVQAGVRSALASLWFLDDNSTPELVAQFYDNVRSGMTKAEALQEAQKNMIHKPKSHPAKWAPFIIIGNWL